MEYYCVTEQECDWIKCLVSESGCLKAAKLSPKPASILDAATFLSILKKVRNLQRSKKKSHSDTEVDYFI